VNAGNRHTVHGKIYSAQRSIIVKVPDKFTAAESVENVGFDVGLVMVNRGRLMCRTYNLKPLFSPSAFSRSSRERSGVISVPQPRHSKEIYLRSSYGILNSVCSVMATPIQPPRQDRQPSAGFARCWQPLSGASKGFVKFDEIVIRELQSYRSLRIFKLLRFQTIRMCVATNFLRRLKNPSQSLGVCSP